MPIPSNQNVMKTQMKKIIDIDIIIAFPLQGNVQYSTTECSLE